MIGKAKRFSVPAMVCAMLLAPALSGCEEEEGTAEKLGEQIDQTVEEAADKMEEAADELEQKAE